MRTKKTVSMKAVVLLMAVVLLIGCTVGGSLAWLLTESKAVTNTFVVGDVGTLTLTENEEEAKDDIRKFTITPGTDIIKDVTVSYSYTDNTTDDYEAVPVYIFVEIDTTGWEISDDGMSYKIMQNGVTESVMSWSVHSDWNKLEGDDGVYYYELNNTTGYSMTKDVIGNNGIITVSSIITKEMIGDVSAKAGNITFKAYAIQTDGHADVKAAWEALNTSNN